MKSSTRELIKMLTADEVDTVPRGWYSTNHIREAAGISIGYANKLVRDMKHRGLITDSKIFKIPCPNRGVYPVPHHRLTKAAAKSIGLTPPT